MNYFLNFVKTAILKDAESPVISMIFRAARLKDFFRILPIPLCFQGETAWNTALKD